MKEIWTREQVLKLVNKENKKLFKEMDKGASFWDEEYRNESMWTLDNGTRLREWFDEQTGWDIDRHRTVDIRELFYEWSYEEDVSKKEVKEIEALIEETGYTHITIDW